MRNVCLAFVLVCSLAFVHPVFAGYIIQPISVASSAGEFINASGSSFRPAVNLINQNGLSASYTSGVTDFTGFTSTATHAGPGVWLASGPPNDPATQPPATLDFDLGSNFLVGAMALWGSAASVPTNDPGIKDFSLIGSLQSDFSNPINLGNFSASTNTSSPTSAQVFSFIPATVRYVQLTINTNQVR